MSPGQPAVGLLDVDVLIALAWPNHVAHAVTRKWFAEHAATGWSTTPVTELGFVRVSSNRRALPTSTSPSIAGQMLEAMCALPGHRFWADSVSHVTAGSPALESLTGHRQVTDAHLLALCADHGGRLVTLDRGVSDLAAGRFAVEILQG